MPKESAPEHRSSLRKIIKEQKKSFNFGKNETKFGRFGFLHSGLMNYDARLYPSTPDSENEPKSIIDHIYKIHARTNKPVRVMDYGCGSNEMLRQLKKVVTDIPLEVVGVGNMDIRRKEQRVLDKKNGVTFVRQKGQSFSAPKEMKYDLILSQFTLQHVFDMLRVMRQLYRSLAPDGQLRIDIEDGKTQLAARFRKSLREPYESEEAALERFKTVVKGLQETGVDIRISSDYRRIVINKTSAKMDFKNVRYGFDPTFLRLDVQPHLRSLYRLEETETEAKDSEKKN